MVDVIVPTCERPAMLLDALGSLLRLDLASGCPVRIIVVDNGSAEGARHVVPSLRPPPGVRLDYVAEPTRGVAHARNRGLREATAEWIAFLDDDELADPAWLHELIAVAATSGARCVGGRVVLAPGDAMPRLPPFCRGLLGETPSSGPARPFAGKALPATGNVILHRCVLDAIGAFDPSLDTGCEDADFFRRARRAGFAPWYAPRACVLHRVPSHRATSTYLLWTAGRHGAGYARIDRKEGGLARVARDGLLRAGEAAFLTLPRWIRAHAAGDEPAQLEQRCRLARALGYDREALRLVAPRLFSQTRFFGLLEFGQESSRFVHAHPDRP